MPTKPKRPQPKTPDKVQTRDFFQTPAYAFMLLKPFIPKHISLVWECACGDGVLSRVMLREGYNVWETDLSRGENQNFLKMSFPLLRFGNEAIITNPPFSIREEFIKHAYEIDIPFAFLMPADYNQWLCNMLREYKLEKIVPDRRINYITPNMLANINAREGYCGWNSIKDVPADILRAEMAGSSAQFHSMWLTRGFKIGQSETIVHLSREDMLDI